MWTGSLVGDLVAEQPEMVDSVVQAGLSGAGEGVAQAGLPEGAVIAGGEQAPALVPFGGLVGNQPAGVGCHHRHTRDARGLAGVLWFVYGHGVGWRGPGLGR